MGQRGPIAGATFGDKPGRKPNPDRQARLGNATVSPSKLPAPSRSLALVSMGGTAPPPPDHLGELGRQVWLDVWEGFPSAVLNDRLDRLAVTRLAEAADDRENARMYLQELGVLLEEPIVTPRGDVVGTRMVINPAALQVQKLDRQIDLMSDRLGLSPAARARLGLTISKAQLAQADASNLLSRMRRDTSA